MVVDACREVGGIDVPVIRCVKQKILVYSTLQVILPDVEDNVINESEVQKPTGVLRVSHPEGLLRHAARSAVGPPHLGEGDVRIDEEGVGWCEHKGQIVSIKEPVRSPFPVEEVDLVQREAVVAGIGVEIRVPVRRPVTVKEREGCIKRHRDLRGKIG